MAGPITYNSANLNPAYIFPASGGGVTFGANQTANAAEIEATNPWNGAYRFNNCNIVLSSYTLTKDEQIYLGNGAAQRILFDASNLNSGLISGTDEVFAVGTFAGKINPMIAYFLGDITPADIPATSDTYNLIISMPSSWIIAAN
jgi:hypothetical protein